MTRIMVISDTHMPITAAELPKPVIDEIKKSDILIHAGDLIDMSLLAGLQKLCPKVIAVRGNMDQDPGAEQLKEKEILEIGPFRIGIMHGKGAPDKLLDLLNEEFKNDRLDMVIFGHSHSPLNKQVGKTIFFNPGSPTEKVFSPYNSYGIIEISDKIKADIIKL